MAFLKSLSGLNYVAEPRSSEKRQIRERVAAATLFDWEVSFQVCLSSVGVFWTEISYSAYENLLQSLLFPAFF